MGKIRKHETLVASMNSSLSASTIIKCTRPRRLVYDGDNYRIDIAGRKGPRGPTYASHLLKAWLDKYEKVERTLPDAIEKPLSEEARKHLKSKLVPLLVAEAL